MKIWGLEMIPKTQLESIKPIRDQLQRIAQVKSKRKISFKKGRLSKRARQWALWIDSVRYKTSSEPKGKKWMGNKPMSERKK